MPTSARKSSVGGTRRGPQRAHIPYRGDNPEVGKKTGISVQHVERKSDGFEPFDEVLQQIDGRTPPRLKAKKRQSVAAPNHFEDDYDDEDGEQSMQIDSPVVHLANLRRPTTPTTAGRSRPSIRPVARTSDVDFDRIPSPNPPNLTRRNAANGAPGPSSLRKSIREPTPQSDPASESDNEPAGDYGGGGGGGYDEGGFDDYGPQESPEDQRTPRRAVFSRIEEEDENENEDQDQSRNWDRSDDNQAHQEMDETPTKNRKGKRKAVQDDPQYDEDVENEIAQGLDDVGLGSDREEEEEERASPPPVKKTKVARENKKAVTTTTNTTKPKTQTRSKKENRPEPREGVRRSMREHMRPLEYWRGEKVVYGRSNGSGPVLVPHIKEIVRIPKDETLPLKRKRGSTRPRSRSRAAEDVIAPPLPVVNPEEGWDDPTQPLCTVIHYTTKEEVERRIAYTAKMVVPRKAADNSWSFDKIFGDDDFIASGQLIIPPHGRKPSKAAKDNTYIFYVIEGAVNFKIHQTSMIMCTGGMFMVPRGNTYLIENISNRDARLFFTQARKVAMNDEERAAKADHAADRQRRRSTMRSSSAGAPSTAGALSAATTAATGRAMSLAALPSTKKA